MKNFRKELIRRFEELEPHCSNIRLEFGRYAIDKDFRWREEQIGRSIPGEIKKLGLSTALSLRFSWTLKHEASDPLVRMAAASGGEFEYDLNNLTLDSWESGWKDAFENPEDYGLDAASKYAFDELFPFLELITGDVIALVSKGEYLGDVIYLNHEGGELVLGRLASSLEEFLNTWVSLGCPGPDFCELEDFFDSETQTLSLRKVESQEWAKILSKNV